MNERNLQGSLLRLHILHHASQSSIFGIGIINELARHGYKISIGTLYPILHGLERDGFLTSKNETIGGRQRRSYTITPKGNTVLHSSKNKVWNLFKELFDNED